MAEHPRTPARDQGPVRSLYDFEHPNLPGWNISQVGAYNQDLGHQASVPVQDNAAGEANAARPSISQAGPHDQNYSSQSLTPNEAAGPSNSQANPYAPFPNEDSQMWHLRMHQKAVKEQLEWATGVVNRHQRQLFEAEEKLDIAIKARRLYAGLDPRYRLPSAQLIKDAATRVENLFSHNPEVKRAYGEHMVYSNWVEWFDDRVTEQLAEYDVRVAEREAGKGKGKEKEVVDEQTGDRGAPEGSRASRNPGVPEEVHQASMKDTWNSWSAEERIQHFEHADFDFEFFRGMQGEPFINGILQAYIEMRPQYFPPTKGFLEMLISWVRDGKVHGEVRRPIDCPLWGDVMTVLHTTEREDYKDSEEEEEEEEGSDIDIKAELAEDDESDQEPSADEDGSDSNKEEEYDEDGESDPKIKEEHHEDEDHNPPRDESL